ncbi:MAG: ribonuclease H-like domain-containing protein [Dehalococcoidia bacterium]|nr:ribonuclease H-like domain-containing protein [Dehalococcoidia bacterium]MDP6227382.1 ribonuclease H-like domain-containing protein [Dehalococcoidia bacterium]MDP7084206.1 ribonuclease H-like domain-containing protein [Dehalococcoidia bacterium]MDP7201858.1 ribonuclease H-like domain-containing protein [Dehalococcoidia bacterium]MDP7510637.1 ribonuclease H-like domain-containing protein [Dehalococcoidia bacterium]
MDAYLDIETTGLSPRSDELTVVGVFIDHDDDGDSSAMIQLVGDEITAGRLQAAFQGVSALYTFNGSRFDVPFIRTRLGVDLEKGLRHRDLMYDCWDQGLRGGLKKVERALGIRRKLPGMDGLNAIRLWDQWRANDDEKALSRLLEYNKEDILNLKTLRALLDA